MGATRSADVLTRVLLSVVSRWWQVLWPVLGLEKLADQVVVDLLPRDCKFDN